EQTVARVQLHGRGVPLQEHRRAQTDRSDPGRTPQASRRLSGSVIRLSNHDTTINAEHAERAETIWGKELREFCVFSVDRRGHPATDEWPSCLRMNPICPT